MNKTFTARECYDECARELKQRDRVYARLVEQGKMKQAHADRQIALMTQIRDRFAAEAEAEEKAGRLI